MTEIAKEKRLATQMGTQIHAGANYRRAVERVQSGGIGPVGEVHVWLGANFKGPPKPASDDAARRSHGPAARAREPRLGLWLGPAPYPALPSGLCAVQMALLVGLRQRHAGRLLLPLLRPGVLGLELRYPTTVEAEGPVHPESTARWTIARQQYPARGNLPPSRSLGITAAAYPAWVKEKGVPAWCNAVLFVGSEGMLIADYGRHELLPKAKFAAFKPPALTIPDSAGHHKEWIDACKTGSPTTCNFDYSGPLAEAALLCNVALRTGKKLVWDAAALKATNCPEADRYLRPTYRAGWTL